MKYRVFFFFLALFRQAQWLRLFLSFTCGDTDAVMVTDMYNFSFHEQHQKTFLTTNIIFLEDWNVLYLCLLLEWWLRWPLFLVLLQIKKWVVFENNISWGLKRALSLPFVKMEVILISLFLLQFRPQLRWPLHVFSAFINKKKNWDVLELDVSSTSI